MAETEPAPAVIGTDWCRVTAGEATAVIRVERGPGGEFMVVNQRSISSIPITKGPPDLPDPPLSERGFGT
jgi:hypothetical protein